MARTYTADQLVTKCQYRGNYPAGSVRLTSTVWYDFLESAMAELWDELISHYGEDYYTVRSSPANFVASTESYALPADFLKLLGMDVRIGGVWKGLERFDIHQRNDYQAGGVAFAGWGDRAPYKYRIESDSVFIAPIPTSTDQYRFVYIKCSPKITSGAQTIDGLNGWEELLVLYAVRRAKVSQDEPHTAIDQEIDRQMRRILNAADGRDAGRPSVIADPTEGF